MKRSIDILFSTILLAVGSPVMLIAALLIFISMGCPIFFCQDRPGKGGRIFNLRKFRTMTNESVGGNEITVDHSRVTPLGHFLRRFSIDELPQLWNVLKGDMSLVGPRPLLVEYLPLYSGEQNRRHEVRPGLTGWAQVNGRNALKWDEKFALDVWYVDNHSIALDFKILALTCRKILTQEGIDASNEVTMPKFMGATSDQSDQRGESV